MGNKIQNIAQQLDDAAFRAKATHQIAATFQINLDDAYAIQKISLNRRYERGEVSTGYKMGFTSRAKMEQMGVHNIIWGRLTNKMEIANGNTLQRADFIHPRVEPEIAFKIKKTIDKTIAFDAVHDYIAAIAPALEIIDSRYENFKFSLEDVVADNCSSAAYVLGDWLAFDTNIQNLNIEMRINENTVQTGNSNAILGNPLESLVEASKMMEKYQEVIPEGAIVLAGAATPAVYINEGDQIKAIFEGLGELGFEVM